MRGRSKSWRWDEEGGRRERPCGLNHPPVPSTQSGDETVLTCDTLPLLLDQVISLSGVSDGCQGHLGSVFVHLEMSILQASHTLTVLAQFLNNGFLKGSFPGS